MKMQVIKLMKSALGHILELVKKHYAASLNSLFSVFLLRYLEKVILVLKIFHDLVFNFSSKSPKNHKIAR